MRPNLALCLRIVLAPELLGECTGTSPGQTRHMDPNIYVLEDVEIDEGCFELRRNGVVVPVEPRVLEFILYLVRHRPRLVSKHELLDQVWSEALVVDSVLTRCACLARQALGRHELIRTVYGRGYRWTRS
jgi:DNA-binding winged helix-turn-helix (wHTH) protein